MVISGFRAWHVEVPLPAGSNWRPAWSHQSPVRAVGLAVARLETDDGLVGWTSTFSRRPELIGELETVLWPLLRGRDPRHIEEIDALLRQVFGRVENPWFIEIAVWDIVGKATGRPLYRLLGGHKDRVKVYASMTSQAAGDTGRAWAATERVSRGFRAAKVHLHPSWSIEQCLSRLHAVKSAVGDQLLLAVDGHQPQRRDGSRWPAWTYEQALRIARELEQLGGIIWLEDCLPDEEEDELRRLVASTTIKIVISARPYTLAQANHYITTGCCGQLQPDAGLSHGVWTARKIAALLEAHNLTYSPHTYAGLGFAANLHLAAACPNCEWLEWHGDPPWLPVALGNLLLAKPFRVAPDGTVAAPQEPGLGVEIDLAALAELGGATSNQ